MPLNLLTRRIPFIYLLAAVLATGFFSWWLLDGRSVPETILTPVASPGKAMHPLRVQGKLTNRLLLIDTPEDSTLSGLRQQFERIIAEDRAAGNILRAGIYLRHPDDGRWISINGDEGFHPASLIKVPILITYLYTEEQHPGLLDTRLTYTGDQIQVPDQTFKAGDTLVRGKSYTIRQLLFNMAALSDNNATVLLLQHIDAGVFRKLFTDLGMPSPPEHDMNFRISPSDYARFLRVLYNGTYLSHANSEYALSILARSSFHDGLEQAVPAGLTIAHKFGEFNNGPNKELHEAGIIYYHNSPWMLVLMTEGKDVPHLTAFMKRIGTVVSQEAAR